MKRRDEVLLCGVCAVLAAHMRCVVFTRVFSCAQGDTTVTLGERGSDEILLETEKREGEAEAADGRMMRCTARREERRMRHTHKLR